MRRLAVICSILTAAMLGAAETTQRGGLRVAPKPFQYLAPIHLYTNRVGWVFSLTPEQHELLEWHRKKWERHNPMLLGGFCPGVNNPFTERDREAIDLKESFEDPLILWNRLCPPKPDGIDLVEIIRGYKCP